MGACREGRKINRTLGAHMLRMCKPQPPSGDLTTVIGGVPTPLPCYTMGVVIDRCVHRSWGLASNLGHLESKCVLGGRMHQDSLLLCLPYMAGLLVAQHHCSDACLLLCVQGCALHHHSLALHPRRKRPPCHGEAHALCPGVKRRRQLTYSWPRCSVLFPLARWCLLLCRSKRLDLLSLHLTCRPPAVGRLPT